MKSKPELTIDTIKRMEDMTWFTHAQIFDDLLIVAQKETACYIWKTAKGLVVFDGIWPNKAVYKAIIEAIKDAGWESIEITKFVITHGHIDHVGCGKWLVEHHNVTAYLSETDDIFRREQASEPNRPDNWKEFDINIYVKDGDFIDCGDKSIIVLSTPGHTEGCLSYIFPVFENGEKHMAALFGGATPPWNSQEGTEIYRQSIKKFISSAKQNCVDVALSNHTAFDNGLQRIAYSKERMTYLPNIYVLGERGFEKFCEVYVSLSE